MTMLIAKTTMIASAARNENFKPARRLPFNSTIETTFAVKTIHAGALIIKFPIAQSERAPP